MSLILDALSRSQRERGGDVEVPGIDTQHYQTSVPAQRNWRVAIPWVALAFALLVITFLLTRKEGGSQSAEHISPTVIAEQAPAVSAEPANAVRTTSDVSDASYGEPQEAAVEPSRVLPATPMPNPHAISPAQSPTGSVSSVVASPDSDAVAALYDTPSTASDGVGGSVIASTSPRAARDAQKSLQKSVDGDFADTEARLSSAQTSGAGATRETTEPVDVEALLARAKQEVAQSRLSEHTAPFLEQLSQQKKDQIPTLMYSRHDYSSQASQSSVLINGKTAKVGDTVASGVKLDEILPDSSVSPVTAESRSGWLPSIAG